MDRITDRPDMTSAVDRGLKAASTQTNKQNSKQRKLSINFFALKCYNTITNKMWKKQEQGNARNVHRFKTSKAHRFVISVVISFIFIAAYDK